jgi:hypothetical protein
MQARDRRGKASFGVELDCEILCAGAESTTRYFPGNTIGPSGCCRGEAPRTAGAMMPYETEDAGFPWRS